MRRSAFIILFLLLCIFSSDSLIGQVRYEIIGASKSTVVIINPTAEKLSIGDRFTVQRKTRRNIQTLAIVEVDRFLGKFCRLRIRQQLMKKAPKAGDFITPYDSRAVPRNEAPAIETPVREKTRQKAVATTSLEKPLNFRVGLTAGLGFSNFRGYEFTAGKYNFTRSGLFPIGAQVLLGVSLIEIGAEFSYAIYPFTFNREEADGTVFWVDELAQMQLGGVLRLHILKGPAKAFLRGGLGYYIGDFSRTYDPAIRTSVTNETGAILQDQDIDLDNSPGFNIGGGFGYRGAFIEFVYHFVDRERTLLLPNASGQLQETKLGINADNGLVQVGILLTL